MRSYLPSFAEAEKERELREFVARRAGAPASTPAPVVAPPVVAPPVREPIERPPVPSDSSAEPQSSTAEDIASGVGRFFVGALADDGEIFQKKRAREAQAAASDPGSAASQMTRRRMAPMLLSLGLTRADIESLSAADITQMSKGGNLVSSLATARGKAQESRAAREMKLQDREYDEGRAVIDDERRGNTAGSKMERATAMAGAAAGRQADAFAHSDAVQARAFGQAAALQGRREDAAIDREDRQATRERDRQARASRIEMEKEYAAAEAELDALEDKLEKRAADEALPGNENIVSKTGVQIKSAVMGGTGRSSEDSILETDLDRAGNATYRITNGVANTAKEQEDAKRIFRGSGAAGSALQAIREQRKKMRAAQSARLSVLEAGGSMEQAQDAARAAGGVPAADLADPDLGIEVVE